MFADKFNQENSKRGDGKIAKGRPLAHQGKE